MDLHEKHHELHRKERELPCYLHAVHLEQFVTKDMLPFHPAWLVVFGTVLVLVAMAIWIMVV